MPLFHAVQVPQGELRRLRDFHAVLRAGGIDALLVPSPGTGYEFRAWRRALNDFAPRLFR